MLLAPRSPFPSAIARRPARFDARDYFRIRASSTLPRLSSVIRDYPRSKKREDRSRPSQKIPPIVIALRSETLQHSLSLSIIHRMNGRTDRSVSRRQDSVTYLFPPSTPFTTGEFYWRGIDERHRECHRGAQHRHRYNIAGCTWYIYIYTHTHAHVQVHRDISMLSGDIIERRIQMNPELLGFPCSTSSPPTLSFSLSTFRLLSTPPSLSQPVLSPGTSPSFPAAGAFLWPFDASRAPLRSPAAQCLEERCEKRSIDSIKCPLWPRTIVIQSHNSLSSSSSPFFSAAIASCIHGLVPLPNLQVELRGQGGENSRRECARPSWGTRVRPFRRPPVKRRHPPSPPLPVNILKAASIPKVVRL